MAILGDFDKGYTKTGNDGLSRWADGASYLVNVPVIGGLAKAATKSLGYVGAGWEGAKLLLQGKPLSAATEVAAGFVGTTVDIGANLPGVGTLSWWINPLVGATTGRSLGAHARKVTEEAIGGVTGLLGVKPTILRSYPAGIGSIDSGMAQDGPGQFASAEAQRRGQDPRAYYNSKMNGDMAQHVAELESARSQPGYQGLGA